MKTGSSETDLASLHGKFAVMNSREYEKYVADVVRNLSISQKGEVYTNAIPREAGLSISVQLQIRKAIPIDDASNYYDLEHLSYLPYVDAMFTDKRIATLTRQVLDSNQLPSSLARIEPPIAIPNSVDSIESHISSLA
jgi:hypothetical protein